MAMSKQVSPTQVLVTFCLWAKRAGYSVDEMHGFSTVHQVHGAGSFHYDSDGGFGHAADINWPAGGTVEHQRLITARQVAEQLGLAVTFAEKGTKGSAAQHTTHLHTDVGEWSNLGAGNYRAPGGGDKVTVALQAAVRASQDMVWGPDTDRRLQLVRAASKLGGVTFPQGVAETQRVVGTPDDDDWGDASRAAHDATVEAIQVALGVKKDHVWGPKTDAAFAAARDIRHRS